MTPVCTIAGLGKSYRGKPVFTGLELAVNTGETVAITGKSGSGKSTLLNILGLLETLDQGSATLFGQPLPPIRSSQATRLRRTKLGYLFQNYALVDNESLDYNLRIAQTYAKGSAGSQREARAAALNRVGLPNAGRRKVYELSGGEQQRLAIARLLLKPCQLVLADEPTGSLDPDNRDAVLAMLQQLAAQGKTVILVTHDEHVARTSDRVFSLPDPAPTSE
jgi:putative ABC transport system ATP-binding protein